MSIRIDKVVTRGGDGGQTSLGDGSRVGKDSARVEALGALDEVNAVIGLVRAHADQDTDGMVDAELAAVQNLLFDMGADLCQPEGPKAHRASRMEGDVLVRIEEWVERLRVRQQPLNGFVLPGGTLAAAWAHMARTQTRVAERRLVALAAQEQINPVLVKILNRLSDYFFVLARYFNQDGKTDVLWRPAPAPKG